MKIILLLLYLLHPLASIRLEKNSKISSSLFTFDSTMFEKFFSKQQNNTTPVDTLHASLTRTMNGNLVPGNLHTFMKENRKWDYKLYNKQLQELFQSILSRQEPTITQNGIRSFMHMFMNYYVKCDKDQDNVLSFEEFSDCMQNDPFFNIAQPPQSSKENPQEFYQHLFNILDDREEGYLNFLGYMKLRVFIFSWHSCSVMSPFIDEQSFECTLTIISQWKTASHTTGRNIYNLALELSSSPMVNHIDFSTFVCIANTVSLFSSINMKGDNDISRGEFNEALDVNALPARYNQRIIDQLFQLIAEYGQKNQGLDLASFIFYDFALQLFSGKNKQRPYFLNKTEFYQRVKSKPMFPYVILSEILNIPQYNMTGPAYKMYQYVNVAKFHSEDNFFTKFLEMDYKSDLFDQLPSEGTENQKTDPNSAAQNENTNSTKNKFGVDIDLEKTCDKIFDILNVNNDGLLEFSHFAFFFQVSLPFSRTDKFHRGVLTAGELFSLFKYYSDYPSISYQLKKRAERFFLFNANVYFDLLSTLTTLNIEDIVAYYHRSRDKSNVNEIEIRRIFRMVNMQNIPEDGLNKCLRGVDMYSNTPKYDWECSFIVGLTANLNYVESMNNYRTAKINNMELVHTQFFNIDPNYQ